MSNASTYPHWVFDNSPIPDPLGHGEQAVQFINFLKHPKSLEPGRKLKLCPWQERIVRAIYGPRDADGERIVTRVFFYIPRGNRKTSLAATLALLHLIGPEKVPGGEIIFAAADRRQAGVGFKEAAGIVRMDKRLGAVTRIYNAKNSAKSIDSKLSGFESTLEVVSSDGGNQNGGTPTFVLCDEIHAWKETRGNEMWEVLESGVSKRKNGLIVTATTAGRGAQGFAAEQYDYARRVALGEINDPSLLPIMFELQGDEDWKDEKVWHRCNPGLSYGFQDIKDLHNKATKAKHSPANAAGFQQYHLNVWHGNSRDPLFNMATYDARKFDDDETDLEALPCWVGVDMARNGDTAAVVAAWRHDDDQITIKPWFFVPGEGLKEKGEEDRVPYERWRDDGLITATPGPIIDPDAVEDHIRELAARHNVQEIAFDPHLAKQVMQHLYDDGLPVIEFRQTNLNMGVAAGDLERIVNGRIIRHDGHPVLRHHFDSVVVSRRDNGLTLMHKSMTTNRKDGADAAAMAVHRAVAQESNQSKYNDPNFQSLAHYLEEAA